MCPLPQTLDIKGTLVELQSLSEALPRSMLTTLKMLKVTAVDDPALPEFLAQFPAFLQSIASSKIGVIDLAENQLGQGSAEQIAMLLIANGTAFAYVCVCVCVCVCQIPSDTHHWAPCWANSLSLSHDSEEG